MAGDVALNVANESHSRTEIHAEPHGFNHDFIFKADARGSNDPNHAIDGLQGRGKSSSIGNVLGGGYGVVGLTETADDGFNLSTDQRAGVIGTGFHQAS